MKIIVIDKKMVALPEVAADEIFNLRLALMQAREALVTNESVNSTISLINMLLGDNYELLP